MTLQERIQLLVRLGAYMQSSEPGWIEVQHRAFLDNNWFIPEFIKLSIENITGKFLAEEPLQELAANHAIPGTNDHPQKVGLVLAGNIPLVGLHDIVCTFITGHHAYIKPSARDTVLPEHLIKKIIEWEPAAENCFKVQPLLKNCDAYIATGSNNTSRYFDYYFARYPHIIRRNRSSAAVLTGNETGAELEKLSDDICQYFGLGCRNVTQLFVPRDYQFEPLLAALNKWDYLGNHHKYKNNYDYNLAAHILNNRYYMTNGHVVLVEDASLFSPIAQVHYQFYDDIQTAHNTLKNNSSVQCVVGNGYLPFGGAQCPELDTFADGVDTVDFLLSLSNAQVRKS